MGILDNLKEKMEKQMAQVRLTYLGGHPDLSRSMLVSLSREDKNLNLYRGGKLLITIPLSNIKSTRLERASSRSLGKAAVGAAAGGVLLGPLGLIAGGALGGRKRNESVIKLIIQYNSTELEVFFGGVGKENVERKYPRFVKLLK